MKTFCVFLQTKSEILSPTTTNFSFLLQALKRQCQQPHPYPVSQNITISRCAKL